MTDQNADGKPAPRAVFHYIKCGDFRTIHVDGAIGSLTPSGHVHCAIYSERPAIPKVVSYELDSEGGLIEEAKSVVESKTGFVRELQADLVLEPDVARALAKWFSDVLDSSGSEESERGTLQ